MSFHKYFWVVLTLVVIFFGLFFYLAENKKANQATLNISGLVVPHHNLVAPQRAEIFSELSKLIAAPKTIILLSPNHYSAGRGSIQTTDKIWHLGQGQIEPNKNVISFMVNNSLALDEESSFVYEHGIYNILPDIHNNFPSAQIVPIIFKNTSQGQLDKLKQGLKESCADCLIIASVDFSHYTSDTQAQLQDKRSIGDLETFNASDMLTNTGVDSGPALALLTMWAKDHGTNNFVLKNHTFSGIDPKNPDGEGTSHVFGWYQ